MVFKIWYEDNECLPIAYVNLVSSVLVYYASLHARMVWIFDIYDNCSISLLFTILGKVDQLMKLFLNMPNKLISQ